MIKITLFTFYTSSTNKQEWKTTSTPPSPTATLKTSRRTPSSPTLSMALCLALPYLWVSLFLPCSVATWLSHTDRKGTKTIRLIPMLKTRPKPRPKPTLWLCLKPRIASSISAELRDFKLSSSIWNKIREFKFSGASWEATSPTKTTEWITLMKKTQKTLEKLNSKGFRLNYICFFNLKLTFVSSAPNK